MHTMICPACPRAAQTSKSCFVPQLAQNFALAGSSAPHSRQNFVFPAAGAGAGAAGAGAPL